MTRIDAFKSALVRRDRLVGTFVKTPSPILAEVLGATKLDCVCLDAEHAPFDRMALDQMIAHFRAADMPSLVRVQTAQDWQILNALDCGATGVVIPHIRSAEEAAGAVKAAHFGRGGRGYAGSTRAASFGGTTIPAHMQASAGRTAVIGQIEDVEAVERIDEIVAVEGMDALFVGRIDLTVSLGAVSPAAPEVVEAVETVVAKAAEAGRTVGMFTPTVEEALAWSEKGASFFLLASEHSWIKAGANALADAMHGRG